MMTVDNVFLIIVLISIFVGFFRGFIKEIISIFSLLTAIWVSINYGSSVGSYSKHGSLIQAVNYG